MENKCTKTDLARLIVLWSGGRKSRLNNDQNLAALMETITCSDCNVMVFFFFYHRLISSPVQVVYYQEAQMTPSHTRANIINVGVPNTCAASLLTLLLKASHDLDIGEVLQLVAHRDGVVRGAELTVYGRL